MAVKTRIILLFSVWMVFSALLIPSTEMFLTFSLVAVLITLGVGELYLPRDVKDSLKFSAYLLLLVFAFMVASKIYTMIE